MLTKDEFDSLAVGDLIETNEPLFGGLTDEPIVFAVRGVLHPDTPARTVYVEGQYLTVSLGRWKCKVGDDGKVVWGRVT